MPPPAAARGPRPRLRGGGGGPRGGGAVDLFRFGAGAGPIGARAVLHTGAGAAASVASAAAEWGGNLSGGVVRGRGEAAVAGVAGCERVPAGGARGQGRRPHWAAGPDDQASRRRDPRPSPRHRRRARRSPPDRKIPASSLAKFGSLRLNDDDLVWLVTSVLRASDSTCLVA